jgi:hypothetical protein
MHDKKSPIDLINDLSELFKKTASILQDNHFDYLAISKREQTVNKLKRSDFAKIRKIYLGDHLRHCKPLDARRQFDLLPPDFFQNHRLELPAGSVLLLTNNDIAKELHGYLDYYHQNPDLLFVVWDWDSQHWIKMSSILAISCDFYVPSTSENIYLLSHFNPFQIGPVFAGVHQWSRQFMAEHWHELLGPRRDDPLGVHAFYGDYQRRNRSVATLNKFFASINFGTNEYKSRSDLENLREWAGHKTHWIAPVMGGVPIRVYNALIVGGVPILPSFYRNMPEVNALGDIPLYYDVADMLDPIALNMEAVAKFDTSGVSGLIERVAIALSRHHIDRHCENLLVELESRISNTLNDDHSFLGGYHGMRL